MIINKDRAAVDALMTSKAVRWLDVHSSRERVNVIIPGTGYRGEGNHFFPAARGDVRAYITRCVLAAIERETEIYANRVRRGWRGMATDAYGVDPVRVEFGNGMNLPDGWTLDGPYAGTDRGHYRVTVWAPIVRD